jgi:hypothetical protein
MKGNEVAAYQIQATSLFFVVRTTFFRVACKKSRKNDNYLIFYHIIGIILLPLSSVTKQWWDFACHTRL